MGLDPHLLGAPTPCLTAMGIVAPSFKEKMTREEDKHQEKRARGGKGLEVKRRREEEATEAKGAARGDGVPAAVPEGVLTAVPEEAPAE